MRFLELEPEAFKAEVDTNADIFLLDVREEYEFEDVNIGGQNIPLAQVLSNVESFRGKPEIHIICNSGKRSIAIAYHLSKKLEGCTIYSCKGGIKAYKEL